MLEVEDIVKKSLKGLALVKGKDHVVQECQNFAADFTEGKIKEALRERFQRLVDTRLGQGFIDKLTDAAVGVIREKTGEKITEMIES